MKIRILITGANGMLGISLCRLYGQSNEVYALHRDRECYASCLADFSLDLMDRSKLQHIFFQIKPDLVIHCAGLTNVDECEKNPELAYDANVTVSEHISQVCGEEAKLVYISSDQVYGKSDNHSESNMDLHPVNIYGKTKLQGEHKARKHCPDHILIRTNIFGWNVKPGKTSFAEWIYQSLKKKQPIILFDDYIFSPVYTECLGEIIIQLVQMAFSGVINAGSTEPCSKYAFGMRLAEIFGFDKSLIIKGSMAEHDFESLRPSNLALNSRRLIDLDITIPDYKTSIKKFRENRPLM